MQNFQALGAPPPRTLASGGWGLCPQTPNSLRRLGAPPPDPQTSPPLQISGYAPAALCTVYNYMDFCSFCFEQFFLDRSVANLMMLTINRYVLNANWFFV